MTTRRPAKKRTEDIPLENIPHPDELKYPTAETKLKAVELFKAGKNPDEIAKQLKIANPNNINKWVRLVETGQNLMGNGHGGNRSKPKFDLAGGLRAALAEARQARAERLEVAAAIVEADGPGHEARMLAQKIRSWVKPPEDS